MSPRHPKPGSSPVPGGVGPGRRGSPERVRCWPLPGTKRIIPEEGEPGSFWEDRGDRHHAGLDLYAPAGFRVVSIEDGRVISAGVFTSPHLLPYWNTTYQVTIAHVSGIFCRYAELGVRTVEEGANVLGGEVVGHVGEVLNLPRIDAGAPRYILALKEQGHGSMLHLEVFTSVPGRLPEYRGGNCSSEERPPALIDPATVLRDAV